MNSFKYIIYTPGGNDTALVLRNEKDQNMRKEINDYIMKKHKNVEQVGFINNNLDNPELFMAGGEFCGNATRCAALYFLQEKPGKLHIKVSGVDYALMAGITSDKEAWAEMPIYPDLQKITKLNDESSKVEMSGITHIVINNQYEKIQKKDELKKLAFSILNKNNLTKTVPASGVMFVSKKGTKTYLRPIVWVRDVKTLFYETACGSGTTAIGLVEASKLGKSTKFSVTQPSNLEIDIEVIYGRKEFKKAIISGPIKVLGSFEYK